MTDKKTQSVKYSDLADYSDVIGTVNIGPLKIQLCDYVESIGGRWYAAGHFMEDYKGTDTLLSNGIWIKTMPVTENSKEPLCLAYVPFEILDSAVPVYKDGDQTTRLVARLKKTLERLNKSRTVVAAA